MGIKVSPKSVAAVVVVGEAIAQYDVSGWRAEYDASDRAADSFQVTLKDALGAGPVFLEVQAAGSVGWEPIVDSNDAPIQITYDEATKTRTFPGMVLDAVRLRSATSTDTFIMLLSSF